MLETPHALVGVAIASKVANPVVSIPLAFASHFVLDMVPHWNPHINTELKKNGSISKKSKLIIASDLVLAVFLSFILAQTVTDVPLIYLLSAAFAGILPDLIEGPYFFLKWKNKLMVKYVKAQKFIQTDVSVIPGVLTQILTIIFAAVWILGS